VKFHNGYPLTPATVGGALQRLLGSMANVAVAGDVVIVKSDRAMTGLLAELARPAASVVARSPDGVLLGTGPFRVARFDAGRHLSLAAFDEHWGGRPFLDMVEIEMGRATRDQFIDLQVGKADVIELAPNEMRTAAERGTKTWVSAPVELLALVFGSGHASGDARLREALALSIDRAAIHNVLLQRQGIVTGALLPEWLSGYAFLFPAAMDLARARQLVAEVPAAGRTLPLAYDPADPQARILAERIALNARDAGIVLQVTTQPKPELRLARARFSTLDAAAALAELSAALGLGEVRHPPGSQRPEALYTAERALLEGFRVVPLFHLPDAYGVGAKVRIWQKPGAGRLGGLNLADIWLETAP
jgi:ABC-type transport system substrate-binding protein